MEKRQHEVRLDVCMQQQAGTELHVDQETACQAED